MKTCRICKEEKPLDDFHNKSGAKDGKQSQCKVCNIARVKKWQEENPERYEENWRRLTSNRNKLVRKAREYNIDIDDLKNLIETREGKCEICNQVPHRWLVVDHCHNTTKVRGILCEKCNQALGLFGDSVESLRSAIEYLQKQVEYKAFTPPPRQKYKQ